MVVYANSAEEAINYCKTVVYFTSHTLTWEVSGTSLSFLDMTVYIDPVTGRLEHKPFRKARSHLERIPFVSHHPFDVRKGTFLGEMSRMAVLSSNPENYRSALSDLQSIYIGRGYPVTLVRKWTKDNIVKRWEHRLDEKPFIPSGDAAVNQQSLQGSNLLVLKTTFNPIWDSFNIHELSSLVVNSWISELGKIPDKGDTVRKMYKFAWSLRPNKSEPFTWPEVKNIAKKHGFDPRVVSLDSIDDCTEEDNLASPIGQASDGIGQPTIGEIVADPDPLTTVIGTSHPSNRLSWEDMSFSVVRQVGLGSSSLEAVRIIDIRTLGLTTARWLLSRKKARNLADQLSRAKSAVLKSASAETQNKEKIDILRDPSPILDDDVAMYDAFDHYDMPMDEL